MTNSITGGSTGIPADNHSNGIGFQEFLSLIQAKGSYPQWQGKCCVHDDKRASMVVRFDEDTRKVLVKCFACNEDLIGGLKARGYWPVRAPSQEAVTYAKGKEDKEFTYEWLTATDGKPPEPMQISGYALAGMWAYASQEGEYLGRVLRYDSLNDPEPGEKRGKQFRPQFFFNTDGGGKWMYKMPPLRPLYNLPSLKNPGKVLVVEGEKTADAAQKLFPDMAVVSPMGGLQGFSKSDRSPLANRELILWSDADANWESNISSWHNILIDVNCARISYVRLPQRLVEENLKWDLADPPPEWFDPRIAIHDVREILIPDRDPILNVKKAEDLKEKFAICTISQNEPIFIYLDTGVQFKQRAFDALYRNLTVPRDLGLPSSYFMNARDRHISYSSITYVPKGPQTVIVNGENCYNEYRPSMVRPAKGDVAPFTDHIKWMLSEEDGQELLCRLANLVQNPDRRPLSAYVLKGAQGLGKNLLFDCMTPLIGRENCAFTDPDSVLSNYNYYSAKKVMVIFNEMTDYERHELYDRLKTVITDETITVRQKYMPEYEIRNYTHIFCMTNHERPIRLPDESERRFYIADAVPTKPQSQDYYDKFVAWRRTSAGPLMHYFLNFNLGSWHPEARPKITDAKRRVVALSKTIPEQMWEKAKELVTDNELYLAVEFAELMIQEGVMSSRNAWKTMDALLEGSGGGRLKGIQWVRGSPSISTGTPCKYVTPFGLEKFARYKQSDLLKHYLRERGLLDEGGKLIRPPREAF